MKRLKKEAKVCEKKEKEVQFWKTSYDKKLEEKAKK